MNIRSIIFATMIIGLSNTSAAAFDLNKLQQGLGGIIKQLEQKGGTQDAIADLKDRIQEARDNDDLETVDELKEELDVLLNSAPAATSVTKTPTKKGVNITRRSVAATGCDINTHKYSLKRMENEYSQGMDRYRKGKYKEALKYWCIAATRRGPWGEESKDKNLDNTTVGRAQFLIGKMYYDGKGVKKDVKTAVKWWFLTIENDKSAMARQWQSNADARYHIGLVHLNGEGGFPKNKKEASDYFLGANWYGDHAEAGKQYKRLKDEISLGDIPNITTENLRDIERLYFQYHLIDLCHGSKLINDKKIKKIRTQMDNLIKKLVDGQKVTGKNLEKVKDLAWEQSQKRFNNDSRMQMSIATSGLGKPMSSKNNRAMRPACDYARSSLNTMENVIDMHLRKTGKTKKKKRF